MKPVRVLPSVLCLWNHLVAKHTSQMVLYTLQPTQSCNIEREHISIVCCEQCLTSLDIHVGLLLAALGTLAEGAK